MKDFAKLYNTVVLGAGGSFKHSNSIDRVRNVKNQIDF